MDAFARGIYRGLGCRKPDLRHKGTVVFVFLVLSMLPATHAVEFEIVSDSFTLLNQVNMSSVTYFQTRTVAPVDPAMATQLLTPGGLYFDGTYYNVWDRTALAWVMLGTGTVETGRVARVGDFMTGQLTTTSTITIQGNAFSVGGSTFVVSSGNVGIGTVTPLSTLDIGSRTDGIILPKGTTAQRPASPATGTMRFNTTLGNLEVYTGTSWGISSATSTTLSLEYLVVAGGGSGNGNGAGGAGGFIEGSLNLLGTYSIVVGAGGDATNGSNSTLSIVTAMGGGAGAGTGGSGGGTNADNTTIAATQTSNGGGTGYGNIGNGNTGGQDGNTGYASGGGGGAGGAGATGSGNAVGGNGGTGRSSSISGVSVCYAGGGGGFSHNNGGAINAGEGTCGGGDGSEYSFGTSRNSTSGAANTGGGGGGRSGGAAGTVIGGSGIVIIRYLTADAVGRTITGGTATTSGSYTVRTFTASGTLVIP